MHLAHPSLSLSGKKKGKLKFKSAEAKRAHEQQAEDWLALKARWGIDADEKRRRRALAAEPLVYSLSAPPGRSTNAHIPSRNTGDGIASTKAIPQYTGTKIKGIGTMHKSNAVPIFSDEEAVEISRMRRG
jgi:hypothetical protein